MECQKSTPRLSHDKLRVMTHPAFVQTLECVSAVSATHAVHTRLILLDL